MTLLQFLVILLFLKLFSSLSPAHYQNNNFNSPTCSIELSLNNEILNANNNTIDDDHHVCRAIINEATTGFFTASILTIHSHFKIQTPKTKKTPPP